ncbi:hypothetical protein QE177_07040 [Arsenophonus sp. aPb]|uniref:hypothetical protein n=1 Tax=Arsenophonus sp. aPb TaxID=3041619 RepID=UPI002469970C|nr:hypothetical protein [Arsenophonus sp. aPb]WGL99613.1 hypothetical protein QE177_07040 [Arsenophonus sp. aPb]
MTTSLNTYARAFQATDNLAYAAGNYDTSMMSKFAKCAVGILTLGLGYGVIYLVERYANVNPKIHEFCYNAKAIADELSVAMENIKDHITVTLDNGQEITIQQDGCNVLLRSQDGQTQILNEMDFAKLYHKIVDDIESNPGIYRIELPKEVEIKNSKEPLTISELVKFISKLVELNNKISADDCLLLRKSPDGNYFYVAKMEDVNKSSGLQFRANQAAEFIGNMLGKEIKKNLSMADFSIITSPHIPVSQTHTFDKPVCSTPSEITMRWITTLARALTKVENTERQKKLITDLLQAQKNRWLAHDMNLEKTVKSLTDDSNALRSNGLNDLANLAYCENSTATDLVSLLPRNESDLHLTQLHDNIYGRYFESVWIAEFVNNPPKEVLNVMHTIGNGIADLLESQTDSTQRTLVEYLQKRIEGDIRFWFNQVDGVSQFSESAWPESKNLLLKLLRNEITNGFESIAIPYLAVKLFNGFSQIDNLRNAVWYQKINSNYKSMLTPHRGRTGATPNNPVSPAAGITLGHQLAAVSESWMTITDRPALHYKPRLNKKITPMHTALQNGIPYSAGISGSTNIMLGIVSHLREQGLNINPNFALLGIMMFMTYDGGHSPHEVLWTANQYGPKAGFDFSAQLNRKATKLAPLDFVSDYQLFANMYNETGCEKAMKDAIALAFEKTILHCERLGKQ